MSRLNPIVVTLETVGDAVFDAEKNNGRRRPIMAKRPDGALVVCCRHTARKHGWEIEGRMFQRTKTPKAADSKTTNKERVVVIKDRRTVSTASVASLLA